ncbi:AAA family ATPase [uncultured Tenacibaculum sp.]|uniref:AAA family ATPase n=1 Tax=uncultured Tenacibaculum sp. TaxID=174713 RepID=UPI0026382D81|nr:AAA family ATPase [uncultured Tenacibaculum sp.]
MNKELENLKQRFLEKWPIKKLQEMQLNEYTNTNREDSFCYWVEHITRDLGSVVGGSSYKFGVYKKGTNSKTEKTNNRDSDGEYAWHTKYGATAEEAFEKIKQIIIDIATNAQGDTIEAIDDIDLGTAYKWKIAFLYGNYNSLNIFKEEALKIIADHLHIVISKKTDISFLHRKILQQKSENKNYYNFTKELWQIANLNTEGIKKEFSNWLKGNETSNKIGSYLRAIDILNEILEIDLYLQHELDELQLLYDNLIKEQRNIHGKYYYEKAPSYGNNGFYSASIKAFMNFLKKIEIMEFEKEDLFSLYHEYLLNNRRNEIADNTIDSYAERASVEIPERWEEYYHTNFKTFKLDYHNLKRIIPLLERGFSGYSSFTPFIYDLIDQFKINVTSTNQILYGPPGTGKTYATKKLAVELINKITYKNSEEDRKAIVEKYNEFHKKEQIVFTTFHQSMSYEDFVEGIKPKTEDKQVTYEIEDGIFKKLANKAKGIKGEIVSDNQQVDFKKINYFKMSVGGKTRKDIHDWCINNNYIALGYGTTNDLGSIIHNSDQKSFREAYEKEYFVEGEHSSYSITAISAFNYWLQKGDIVLVSLGNHIIDAIGVVTGDYEYKNIEGIPYHHFRKVEWLATNLDADPSLFVDKNITQQTIYQFNNDDIKVDYFEQTFTRKHEISIPEDHVLIIDEINRGNVSAIFGELITLLEPDKRLGQDEAITIKLPYSKKEFGIPSNLHIIGTMNTADRSVEALDTALRRRFEFKEMMPKPELLENILFDGFNLKEVLETINNRIELLLDSDHTIGHSYFIAVNSGDTEKLASIFKNKVIPLLQEYFYGDYGKIGLILGKDFIKEKENKKVKFASFNYENSNDFKTASFQLKKINAQNIIKAIHKTLGIETEINPIDIKQITPELANA